jgi:hypothetical protein
MPFSVETTRVFLRDGPATNTLEYGPLLTAANTMSGIVLDAKTGQPLANAEIVFAGYGLLTSRGVPAKTNADGTFSYLTITGAKDLVFSKDGYISQTIYYASGGAAGLEIKLMPVYKVTFLDWDGTVLDEQLVVHGEAAIAPADPQRAGWEFIGWDTDFSAITGDLAITAIYKHVTVTASVEKLNGNKNNLTIFVTEHYSDGKEIPVKATFSIDNNAADTYVVGPYKVYVDTKGNVQIRACYIVE